MRKESALISDKWKTIQDKKDLNDKFWCIVFGCGYIAMLFTMMILKSVYGG